MAELTGKSLQLNLPASPIHDLIVKNDDLVVATHGRAFWILDDLTPLRTVTAQAAAEAVLYKPRVTYRLRWPDFFERRQPGSEPADRRDCLLLSGNCAEGSGGARVLDASGKVVRRYSNEEKKEADTPPDVAGSDSARREIPTKSA